MKATNNKHFISSYVTQLTKINDTVVQKGKEHSYNIHGQYGHYFYQQDLRTPFFYMEGLSRIHRKIGKNSVIFENLLKLFKSVEDSFGAYDYWSGFLNLSKELKLNEKILKYLNEKFLMTLGTLENRLYSDGWVVPLHGSSFASPCCDEVLNLLKDTEWSKNDAKENAKMLAFFRDEAIKTDLKLRSGEININDTEEGVHEVRRRLRWFPIYRIALQGRLQFSKYKTGSQLSGYITPKEKSNPFNKQQSCQDGISPITIHTGAYMGMSVLIRELGEIKDKALFYELMENTCRLTGISFKAILPKIKNHSLTNQEAVRGAEKLISHFVMKENGLQILAEHFNKQIKN